MAYYASKYSTEVSNVLPGGKASTALAVGDLVYLNSSGNWVLAASAAIGSSSRTDALGVVVRDALQYEFISPVKCAELTGWSSLTIGTKYYLSATGTTGNTITSSEPTAYVRQQIGVAISSTSIRVDVSGAAAELDVGGDLVVDTITMNPTVAATGRVITAKGTQAAGALGDGYGIVEIELDITGSPTGHEAAESCWVNITAGTVPPGTYVCAMNNGIYEDAAATITNAKLIFGMRCQIITSDTDALTFPLSINTNNAAITALIDCNNMSDLGITASSKSTQAKYMPIARDAAGTVYYTLMYA